MTVAELIVLLQEKSPTAPVYVWEGDLAEFAPAGCVMENDKGTFKTIPLDAIILWGE